MYEGLSGLPTFGVLLRYYREDADWSQPQLAERLTERHDCPISTSSINKYELGHRRPKGDFIFCLEKCFELSQEEVMNLLEALSTDYLIELIDQYEEVRGE